MIRVYVAGPMTPRGEGNHAIEFLTNLRKGIEVCLTLIEHGFAPFSPFLDFLYWIAGGQLTEEQVKKISATFLRVCDCVLLLDGWEQSSGCRNELKIASEVGLPAFDTIEEVVAWAERNSMIKNHK